MPVHALRLLSMRLARRWLLTLIVSMLSMLAASYFYFTTMHALESFDTGSCAPLALGSSGKCVSSLQTLLNNNQPYPTIDVDGYFGQQTQQAAMEFQSAHHLAMDGVVAGQTADAINKFSPRPSILSYAAGFVNSKLALTAKLCVGALIITVTIMCLLLRAAHTGSSRLLRIRCALAGLFSALIAANSAATESLITEAHGWVAKFLCIILIALTAALFRLLTEMFPTMAAHPAFAEPPSREAGHGS
jgi:hypothetical protein